MYLYPYVYEIIRIDFERNLRKLYTHKTSFHGFWKRSKILCNEFEEGPPPPSVWEQNSYRISVKIRRQCIESRTKVTDALQNQRTVISPAQRLPWTIRQLVRGLNGIFKAPRPSMLQRCVIRDKTHQHLLPSFGVDTRAAHQLNNALAPPIARCLHSPTNLPSQFCLRIFQPTL